MFIMRNFWGTCNVWSFDDVIFKTILNNVQDYAVTGNFFPIWVFSDFLNFQLWNLMYLLLSVPVKAIVTLPVLPSPSSRAFLEGMQDFWILIAVLVMICYWLTCFAFPITVPTRLICYRFVWYNSVAWFCQQNIGRNVDLSDPFI